MHVQHMITKSLIDYDSAQPTIRYLKKHTDAHGIKTITDTERTKMTFVDKKTGDIVLDTEVETLAIYYDKLNVWCWSWSLTGLTNSENFLSKEILLYALKLGSDMAYMKSLLTISRGVIKDVIQIDINLAIGSTIIKQPYIYPVIRKYDNYRVIHYMILLNKEELDKIKMKISDPSTASDSDGDNDIF
jgi:hypothetical protein